MNGRAESLTVQTWIRNNIFLGKPFSEYVKGLFTPFNIVCGIILAVGIPVSVWRFVEGLGATTNLSDTNPWGLWLGFDMFSGVALAAGGFVIGTAVYIFGAKEYKPLVRPAVLTGFLGYLFAVAGLCFDLGRPWRLPYPMVVSLGVASVLFLVAWHVALYLTTQFVEWCPAIFEWLGLKRVRQWLVKLTVGAVIFGAILSTLHQSALGGLFLLMPSKLHPLWYSPFIPILFFVSAIAGGITMTVIESMISHKTFGHQIPSSQHEKFDRITLGLGKAAAFALVTYFVLKVLSIAHSNTWNLLFTAPHGYLLLTEVLGFVLLPCIMFYLAVVRSDPKLVRMASIITVIGIVFNRINVSIIGLNWDAPIKYYPKWSEYVVSITLVTTGVLVFRWIVNRMPILYRLPEYDDEH